MYVLLKYQKFFVLLRIIVKIFDFFAPLEISRKKGVAILIARGCKAVSWNKQEKGRRFPILGAGKS